MRKHQVRLRVQSTIIEDVEFDVWAEDLKAVEKQLSTYPNIETDIEIDDQQLVETVTKCVVVNRDYTESKVVSIEDIEDEPIDDQIA